MLTFLNILFWLAVVAGALAALVWAFARAFAVETQPDSIVFVDTDDDWRLALTRYRPDAPLAGAPPVVLCHGAGFSATLFDMSPGTSLPHFLADQGYDVWSLDLRGRGMHHRQGLFRRRRPWSFDDYVDLDAPAVLEAVCRRTGAEDVQWIGFGTGALVGHAVAPGPFGHRIRSVANIAGAAVFRRQQGESSPRLVRSLRWMWSVHLIRLLAPLAGKLFPPPLRLLQNRDNIDVPIYRRALVNAAASLSRAESNQYAEWLEQDSFTAMFQRRDLRDHIAAAPQPVLLLAGPRDQVAPREMMEDTRDLLEGAEETRLVLASRMHGMSANYGHLDLLIGRSVRRDIFTHLLAWLDRNAGVDVPQDRPSPPVPREPTIDGGASRRRQRRRKPQPSVAPADDEVLDDADQDDGAELDAGDEGAELDAGDEGAEPDAGDEEDERPKAARAADDDLLSDLEDEDEPEDEDDLVTGDVPRVP